MRKALISIVIALAFSVVALVVPGASVANNTATEASLSNSSLFNTQTTITDKKGDYITSTVAPDSNAPITLAADGYPCTDVGYNATVKWFMAITGWTAWTWTMHFGAHVCHNNVQSVNHLYASVDSIMPTWSYCGVVYRYWGPALPYSSVNGHMEGCFQILDKILVQKFPYANITIGGNGGLWARSIGVN